MENKTRGKSPDGVWMTSNEIKKTGSEFHRVYVTQLLRGRREIFESRRRGDKRNSPWEGFITAENYQIVGLPEPPVSHTAKESREFAKRKELQEETYELVLIPKEPEKEESFRKVRFEETNRTYTIYSMRRYSLEFFTEVISSVSSAFTADKIEALFNTVRSPSGTIAGKTILDFLETASKALFLSDRTYQYLAGKGGMNLEDVRDQLEGGPAKNHVSHLKPGLFPYISRNGKDLETILCDIREAVYNVREWDDITVLQEPPISPDSVIKSEKRPEYKIKPSEKETLDVLSTTISVNGKNIKLNPKQNYTQSYVTDILKQIHQTAFTETSISNLINARGWNDAIPGNELIELLHTVNSMMLLSSSSTIKRLESELNTSQTELTKFLESSEGKKYVNKVPGNERMEYILRSQFRDITKAFNKHNGIEVAQQSSTTNTSIVQEENTGLESLIELHQERLRKKRIMLEGNLLVKAIEVGVLDHSSQDAIRKSYEAYEKEISGFRFFNLFRLKETTGITYWYEFETRIINPLIEEGYLKEVISSLGISSKYGIYVVKTEKKSELYNRAMELSLKT